MEVESKKAIKEEKTETGKSRGEKRERKITEAEWFRHDSDYEVERKKVR